MLDQQHGNYKAYYRKRSFDTEERIAPFKLEWFEGKKCVDIGCNEGAVTLKIAETLVPNFIIGLDLDPRMIDAANAALKRAKLDASRALASSIPLDSAPVKRLNPFLPRSLALTKPLVPSVPSSSSGNRAAFNHVISSQPHSSGAAGGYSGKYPANISFVCKNIIDFISSTAKYDVVTCLSVTKWIHLTEGDSGLITLFQIIYQLTSPGGRAIIEYQPWSSYLNNKKTSATTLRVFGTLKIRPEDFEVLLTRDIGFRIEARLGTPLSDAKGFKRPILVLCKDFGSAPCEFSNKEQGDGMEVEAEVEVAPAGVVNGHIIIVPPGSVSGRKRYFGELEDTEAADMRDEVGADEEGGVEGALSSHRQRKKY